MFDPSAPRRFRLLALDVDGTLLDPSGHLRPRTTDAVSKAAAAGVKPVLCTGRRYRRAWPIAHALGLDSPIVCNSGALVKDPTTHKTLWRADLEPQVFSRLLNLFRDHGEPIVVFADRDPDSFDFVVEQFPTGRMLFDQYVQMNLDHAEIDPIRHTRLNACPAFHVCAIGERPAMLDFERAVHAAVPGDVRTFVQKSPQYAGTMCEILHHEASKWSALLHLASQWGITPLEICAVGDDMNDVPMITGAGLGVAMGHASHEIRSWADHVTQCNDQDGVAELIDHILAL